MSSRRQARLFLRVARRFLLAVPATAAAYGWALTASLVLHPWPGAKVRQQGAAFRFWCRSLCRIFAIRVRVTGTPPAPPFFLVSNHLSYVDMLVLGTELPCVFIAKSEIDGWPLFGALCRSVNTIFVDRQTKRNLPQVIAEIDTMLAAGQGVVLFPEGTTGAGGEVMSFRSSLLDLPARMGVPVHTATLGYGVPPGSPPPHLAVAWWGEMPLGAHLADLLRLDWIDAPVTFGETPIVETDRKLLAESLHREISSRFEPMVEAAEVERLLGLRTTDPAALPAVLRPRR